MLSTNEKLVELNSTLPDMGHIEKLINTPVARRTKQDLTTELVKSSIWMEKATTLLGEMVVVNHALNRENEALTRDLDDAKEAYLRIKQSKSFFPKFLTNFIRCK